MKRPLFLQGSRLPPSRAYLFCCRKWIMSSDFLTQLWGSSAVPWAPSPLYGYRKGLPSGWLRLEQYIPCWNASCHRASLGSWSNWVNSFGLGEKKNNPDEAIKVSIWADRKAFWRFPLGLGYQNKRGKPALQRVWELEPGQGRWGYIWGHGGEQSSWNRWCLLEKHCWDTVPEVRSILKYKRQAERFRLLNGRNSMLGLESLAQRVAGSVATDSTLLPL